MSPDDCSSCQRGVLINLNKRIKSDQHQQSKEFIMSTEEDPRFMETYLEHALNVIDHAKHIPKGLFKEAKGVMLISAKEGGFLISSTSGTGVLVAHNDDGSWGAPMALHLNGFGVGAVFGYANQDIVVIMNHFSMNRLLEGRGETRLGLDVGFACGAYLKY